MKRLSTTLCHVLRTMRRSARDQRGTAAVEFALNVPIFAVLIIPLLDVANLAIGVNNMQTAARSVVQYAMNGGGDMSVAQTHGIAAWADRPAGGTMNAVLACLCNASAHACDSPCPDGTPPQSFVTVTAAATFAGNIFTVSRTITSKVRIR
jgi:Flp pilus assembly protein TadG